MFSKEGAKASLEDHDWNLGERVGDPTGCDREGNIGSQFYSAEGGEEHLTRDGEHRDKQPYRKSGGYCFPAGVPEFPVEHRGDDFLEPHPLSQAGTK